MEPEFWDRNPNKVSLRIFPPEFHHQTVALKKTQQFYEFILVNSDSISIKHYKDASNITHSTVQILKVLTPASFGQNPNKTKKKILMPLIPSTTIIGIMSKLGHISSGNKIKPTNTLG